MLLRFLLLSLIFTSTPLSAHADSTCNSNKVQALFKAMKLDQTSAQIMQQAMDQVNSSVMRQLLPFRFTPNQQTRVDEFSGKVAQVVSNALSWEKLEPGYEKIYCDAYTEQQLDDLIAFYQSPTGQVVVEKTPAMYKQSTAIAQERLTAVIPQLQSMMKDFMIQEQKKAQEQAPKVPSQSTD